MVFVWYDYCFGSKDLTGMQLQDLIGQWEGHVTAHERYDASYNECSHCLNELLRRLTRCSDATGDRRDIENMQAKLQVCHLITSIILS